jgi:hypothetical protein
MKNVCWTLIALAVIAFVTGTYLAFMKADYLLAPQGYWRGAIGLLAFAITLRLMEDRKA